MIILRNPDMANIYYELKRAINFENDSTYQITARLPNRDLVRIIVTIYDICIVTFHFPGGGIRTNYVDHNVLIHYILQFLKNMKVTEIKIEKIR